MFQKLLTLMGLTTMMWQESEITDSKKTCLDWFELVCAQLSEITDQYPVGK